MSLPTTISDCKVIALEKHKTVVGDLVIAGTARHEPFEAKRVFYIYDIPSGQSRGAHAHKACHQLLIAASGAFSVLIDDGEHTSQIELNKPNEGLHIPPGIWASELNFSGGAICLVLASHEYEEGDYLRDYTEFKTWKSRQTFHP